MASPIGTLQIDIATNVARIRADMAEVKGVIGSSMKDVEQFVGYAKTAIVGLVGIGSVAAFKGMIDSAIEGKAKLYDVSLQTGIAVEALSGLARVGKLSGTALEEIAGGSNKLSKALFTQTEDSTGAAQGIKALGLNLSELKSLQADQQMLSVAKALNQFQDDAGKSAVAMLLFGKTGATLLPFLKELAERGIMVTKETTASALAAKEYEDNIITLKSAAESWKKEIVTGMLPTLVEVTNRLIDAKAAYGGLTSAFMDGLNLNPFKGVVGNLTDTRDKLAGLRNELATMEERAKSPGLVDRFNSIGSERQAGKLKEQIALLEKREAYLNASVARDANAGFGKTAGSWGSSKPSLGDGLGGKGDKAGTAKDDFGPLMKQLEEKIALDQAELDSVTKLTEGQKLQAKIFADIDGGYIKLTLSQKLAVDGALQEVLAREKLRAAKDQLRKSDEELQLQQHVALQADFLQLKAAQDEVKLLKEQVDQYGLTADELRVLSKARQLDTAALLEWKAQFNGSSEFLEAQSARWREQAQAIRDAAYQRDLYASKEANDRNDPLSGAQRAVKEYLADVKRAGDATYGAVGNAMKGLEDLTVGALSGGNAKGAAKAWVSGILAEVNRLYIVKPLLASLFGGAGGGSSGALAGLLGTAGSYLSGSYDANYSHEGLNFGGPRAAGGPVDAGKNYLVGEKGPEILRMGSQAGTVIPNNKLGGGGLTLTYAPVLHIDSRTDQAQVAFLVQASVADGNRQMLQHLKDTGAIS